MRLHALPIVLFFLAPVVGAAPPADSLVRYVDPFIGTGGHGHTYPGATLPFGMVQLSPDNGRSGWDWCSGYHYSDTGIVGFSHTHLSGTGCADLGDVSCMPITSSRNLDEAYRSPFSHHQESAEPGYYRVRLLDHAILVELTATERAGFHRYTFPRTDSAGIIIDLKRGQDDVAMHTVLNIVDSTLVTGCRFSNGWAADQRVFFAARFSEPISAWAAGSGRAQEPGVRGASGKDARGVFWFGKTPAGKQILVKVGISSVSADNALGNLEAEIKGWDFDAVRAAASASWERALGRVRIESADRERKQVFYTALYHAFLAPTIFSDVNGQYRGADGEIHTTAGVPYYSTYSLWDTYRAAHPLYTIVMPERVDGLMQGMLAFAHESGYLPVWPLAANETNTMVGYHAVPPLADAWLKGFRGFDPSAALQVMEKSAYRDYAGLRFYRAERPEPLAKIMERQQRDVLGVDSYGGLSGKMYYGKAGYARSVEGEKIDYHSSHPGASRALIVRAADGKKPIIWESASVPSAPHS
ncbi:MAG TPA: GH92 family glycosyl hydrolase, partial [Bacteroidota bacterium]